MLQDVRYTSKTYHNSLGGELIIFQQVVTHYINSLYKVNIYTLL